MKRIIIVILCFIFIYSVTAQFNVYIDVTGSSCNNSVQDGNETGIDCGGPCPACPSCYDGIQNQGESGVDCGGPCDDCDDSSSRGGSSSSIVIQKTNLKIVFQNIIFS